MVEDRTRHERIRALLPRAYATDPNDSVLGVVLDVLADRLRDLDHATERALRNKWLATAEAPRTPVASTPPPTGAAPEAPASGLSAIPTIELGGEPKPLEHLGSALDLQRQPWEIDEQAYRARVAQLASLMTQGLATPRALLSFVIGALGAESCPRLERSGDTTTATGLAPGRLARCRACRGGRSMPEGPCPLRAESTTNASLVDNPRRVVRLRRDLLHVGDAGPILVHFHSDSLFADRPEFELQVQADNAPTFDGSQFDAASFVELSGQVVPSFRSRQTNERIVVAYALAPGDTLSILPRSPHDALVPPHQQRWVDRPTSASPLSPVVRVNGVDVDAPVILFRGVTFDGARFGVDRFAPDGDAPRFDVGHFEEAAFDQPAAAGTLEVTTLAVVPGINTWEYAPLDTAGVAAALAAVPPGASLPPAPVVEAMDPPPVALRLRWWTRPAARFLLRIPSTAAVRQSLALGAASYVRRMVDRVRPVGVTAVIDFLEPPFRDFPPLEPSDGLRGVALALVEPLSPLDMAATDQALPAEVLDGLESGAFGGIFDVTPFDFSLFETQLVELADGLEPEVRGGFIGVFDATPFEFGLLAE